MKFAAVLVILVAATATDGLAQEQRTTAISAAPFADSALAGLAEAACEGDRSSVTTRVAQGANPNGLGLEGVTPLFWALQCQSVVGVRTLLEQGSDPNQLISGQLPPVFFASRIQDVEFLSLLLQHGGDPNSQYTGPFSMPLDQALVQGMTNGQWAHWDLLLRSGVDINRPDASHNTTAMKAAELDQYDRVLELLDRGYTYDLPRLRRIVTSPTALRNHPDNPLRLQVVEALDQHGSG